MSPTAARLLTARRRRLPPLLCLLLLTACVAVLLPLVTAQAGQYANGVALSSDGRTAYVCAGSDILLVDLCNNNNTAVVATAAGLGYSGYTFEGIAIDSSIQGGQTAFVTVNSVAGCEFAPQSSLSVTSYALYVNLTLGHSYTISTLFTSSDFLKGTAYDQDLQLLFLADTRSIGGGTASSGFPVEFNIMTAATSDKAGMSEGLHRSEWRGYQPRWRHGVRVVQRVHRSRAGRTSVRHPKVQRQHPAEQRRTADREHAGWNRL